MTIRDMLNQGIQVQGAYQIKRWDDEKETYIMLRQGDMFDLDLVYTDEEVKELDMEVKYLYSIPYPNGMNSYTVFEVE